MNWYLNLESELDWQFATTYAAEAPHEYVVAGKTAGVTEDDVARVAHVIRMYGEPMKFYKETRIYLLITPMGWSTGTCRAESRIGRLGTIESTDSYDERASKGDHWRRSWRPRQSVTSPGAFCVSAYQWGKQEADLEDWPV